VAEGVGGPTKEMQFQPGRDAIPAWQRCNSSLAEMQFQPGRDAKDTRCQHARHLASVGPKMPWGDLVDTSTHASCRIWHNSSKWHRLPSI
jgi:hypothetical protein